MKTCPPKWSFLVLFVMLDLELFGQVATKRTSSAPTIPTINVVFKDGQPIPGLAASPVLKYPFECSPDGTILIQLVRPPDARGRELYAVSASNEVHRLDKVQMSDLHDVSVIDYRAGEQKVLFLVFATREDAQSRRSMTLPNGKAQEQSTYPGEHHYYITAFDKDGTYRGSQQLPDSLLPRRFSAFDDGTFLLLASDDAEKPLLALVGADGTIQRILDLPADFSTGYGKLTNRSGTPGKVISAATQMFLFRDSILVVTRRSKVPIIQVAKTGAIREVKLRIPEGDDYEIDSFVPSLDHWYVRFNIPTPTGTLVLREPVLYEVNPADGVPLIRLHTVGASAHEIACATDNELISITQSDNGLFLKTVAAVRGR